MRRRNYPKHTHFAYEIRLRGKVDSVYVTCACGKEELVALWWTAPPRGWDKTQWKNGLRWAAQLLAESVYVVACHRPMSVKEAKGYFADDLSFIQHHGIKLEPRANEWWCVKTSEPTKVAWADTAVDALEKWKKKYWFVPEKK